MNPRLLCFSIRPSWDAVILCPLQSVPHPTICCDFICCQFPIQLNDKPFFTIQMKVECPNNFQKQRLFYYNLRCFVQKDLSFKPPKFLSCSYSSCIVKYNQYVCRISAPLVIWIPLFFLDKLGLWELVSAVKYTNWHLRRTGDGLICWRH